MRIIKVFNNNVALVENNGKEAIVMGKAIGFQKYPGDTVDSTLVEKTFVLEMPENQERLITLLNEIPIEHVKVTDEIIRFGQDMLQIKLNEYILITLSDHISFAIQRVEEGIEIVSPLQWEVNQIYPKEVEIGKAAIDIVQSKTGIRLPDSEKVFIALHFVNAQLNNKNMRDTQLMTVIISRILDIVKSYYKIELDENSLNYTRFVTHIRYFIKRQMQNEVISTNDDSLFSVVKEKYKKAYKCSLKINKYLHSEYQWECSNDELFYLTLHIQRVTSRIIE